MPDATRRDLQPPTGNSSPATAPSNPSSASTSTDFLALLIQLIPAAKVLLSVQFHEAGDPWGSLRRCSECLEQATRTDLVRHERGCAVGELARIVAAIDLSMRGGLTLTAPTSPAPAAPVIVEIHRRGFIGDETFYEPWSFQPADELGSASVTNALGSLIVDMQGSTIPELDEPRYARRIAACVNFCFGLATAMLIDKRAFELLHAEGVTV